MQANDANYPSLRDRDVLVTGGASGIGAAIVAHFCAQDARVTFLDIADAAAATLATEIAAAGHRRPQYRHTDLTDLASLRATVQEGGPFHVLVNNAARDDRHDWQSVTAEDWERLLAVNLRHQFFAIQAAAPAMIAAGAGSIINFGSIAWHLGMGGMPAYTASKAAVEALTRSFARDLGRHRIRVNCVLPGWIMTERQLALWVDEEGEAMRRAGQCIPDRLHPPDVARLVLWLAADDSRMATGQTWTIDGGWT